MLEGMSWRKMLSREDLRKSLLDQLILQALTKGSRGQQIASDRPEQLRFSG